MNDHHIEEKNPFPCGDRQRMGPSYLYLVLPVYNEEELLEENISILVDYYKDLMDAGEIREDSRILLVDDGSEDRSWEIISSRADRSPLVEGMKLSRNEGQQTVLYAGMREAYELGADLVITGEGHIDHQTALGKTPQAVAAIARQQGVPVVALCGAADADVNAAALGFERIVTITPTGQPLAVAMQPTVARDNIRHAIAQIFSTL